MELLKDDERLDYLLAEDLTNYSKPFGIFVFSRCGTSCKVCICSDSFRKDCRSLCGKWSNPTFFKCTNKC